MYVEMAAITLGAYALGSLPFGVVVGKLKGVDPRTAGSGNIGATNVARLMGWQSGLVVLILDMLKGMIAAWVGVSWFADANSLDEHLGLVTGFAATFGHCYSIFLRGKGGKGVATAIGAAFVVLPSAAGLGVFVWIALAAFFRIAAVSSIASLTVIVVVARLNGAGFEKEIFTAALFCLITIRHISNLKQLKARWFGDAK